MDSGGESERGRRQYEPVASNSSSLSRGWQLEAFDTDSSDQQDYQSILLQQLALLREQMEEVRENQEKQMQECRKQQDKIRQDLEKFSHKFHYEMKDANDRLQGLTDRLNDEVDLYHSDVANIKHDITKLAVRDQLELVDYKSKELGMELHEKLGRCQNKIDIMEKRSHHNYMPYPDNMQGVFLPKLINLLLALIQLIVVLINTINNLSTSMFSTWLRMFLTALFGFCMMMFIMYPGIIGQLDTKSSTTVTAEAVTTGNIL